MLMVLTRLPFLAQSQASVEYKVYHVSTHSMIIPFSLDSRTLQVDQALKHLVEVEAEQCLPTREKYLLN